MEMLKKITLFDNLISKKISIIKLSDVFFTKQSIF